MNPFTEEEHYQINILADNLFSKLDWEGLNEQNVNNLPTRVKIAQAILTGKIPLTLCTLCGTLEDFYPPEEDDEDDSNCMQTFIPGFHD